MVEFHLLSVYIMRLFQTCYLTITSIALTIQKAIPRLVWFIACFCFSFTLQRGAIVSEPAIQVRRKGKSTQVWTIEKLENKLIDMRDLYQEWKEKIPEVKETKGEGDWTMLKAQGVSDISVRTHTHVWR